MARSNLAPGGPGCALGDCEWEYELGVSGDPQVLAPGQSADNAIRGVKIRSGLWRLAWCEGANFTNCHARYFSGPDTIDLKGIGWSDVISSFDLIRETTVIDCNWPNEQTCASLPTFGSAQPGGPTMCDEPSDCAAPYNCVCHDPPTCASSRCEIAACFDHVYEPGSGEIRVWHGEHLANDLLNTDLIAEYREEWPDPVIVRLHEYLGHLRDYFRRDLPAGQAFGNMLVEANMRVWSGPGDPSGGFAVQVPIWNILDEVGRWSARPRPLAYWRLFHTLVHEYTHTVEERHHLDQKLWFGGWGVAEGIADMMAESVVDWTDDLHGTHVYDAFLQEWPKQEYCRPDVFNNPADCYGMKYADQYLYNVFDLGYNANMAWAFLASQFMTPEGITVIDPDDYVYTGAGDRALLKPLRYQRFYRQVADDLFTFPNPWAYAQRKAWIDRWTNQAGWGAGGTPFRKCVYADPSACPLGADYTFFEKSTSFDDAFRRWVMTQAEWSGYSNDDWSRRHLKYEPGGIRGIKKPGGNDQTEFIALPFDLGGPSPSEFTVILTARTTRKSDVLADRDSIRIYIDSDLDPDNRPRGKGYDDEYDDTDQCYAMGHDFSGDPGCRSWVWDHWDTDGNEADPRATMRFIPSSEIPNFAGGDTGPHVLWVAVYNDPIVYSVEVVPGIVTPLRRSQALRDDYCADPGSGMGGDPAEAFCEFDDPSDTMTVATGFSSGNKIIQVMAEADRSERDFDNAALGSMHEGMLVKSTYAVSPLIAGNETKWAGFQGFPMAGNPFLMRAEKWLPAGNKFEIQPHDTPFFHHVMTWDRPAGTIAALYYPRIRGLQMPGYMIDPRSDWFSMYVSGSAMGTPVNFIVYCEQAGDWYFWSEGTIPSDVQMYWDDLPCARVYVMVGMAAPYLDETGQVLAVRFAG